MPARHRPPLLHLVAGGDQPTVLDVAKRLLSEGVDANLVEPEDGLTPLHVAAHWDRLAMVQLLLLHGADPLREDLNGRTPLSMATGETKKFLDRMQAKTEPERKSVLRRIFELHFGTRLGKALKGARKRVRKTIGFVLPTRRPRADSDAVNGPITSTPRPSIVSAASSGAAARPSGTGAASGIPTPGTSYFTVPEAGSRPGSRTSDRPPSRKDKNGAGNDVPIPLVARPATPPNVLLTGEVDIDKMMRERERENVTTRNNKKKKKEKRDRKSKDSGGGAESTEEEEDEENRVPGTPSNRRRRQPSPSTVTKQPDKAGVTRRSRTPEGTKMTTSSASSTGVMASARKRIEAMSEAKLRSELRAVGIDAGPIAQGGGVRKTYERRLVAAWRERGELEGKKTGGGGGGGEGTSVTPSIAGHKYSRPLELAMGGRAWQEGAAVASDESMRAMFINKGVTAFCYLLLDPRILPPRADDVTMTQFVDAIFYVGKGTKARPLQHLIDAKREREARLPRLTAKLARILDIWKSGTGVISLQISHNICDQEALTREGALIEAIGLGNLTNVQSGKLYGGVVHWPPVQRAQLGTLMLKRARHVLLAEGLRPIRPEALPETLFKPPPSSASKPPHPPGNSNPSQKTPARPPPGLLNRAWR